MTEQELLNKMIKYEQIDSYIEILNRKDAYSLGRKLYENVRKIEYFKLTKDDVKSLNIDADPNNIYYRLVSDDYTSSLMSLTYNILLNSKEINK